MSPLTEVTKVKHEFLSLHALGISSLLSAMCCVRSKASHGEATGGKWKGSS